MKYKDSFVKYYIINPIIDIYYNFLENLLDYWWCSRCKKYHSPRIVQYWRYTSKSSCIEEKEEL